MKTNFLKALRLAVKRGLQKLGELIWAVDWMNGKAERQLSV